MQIQIKDLKVGNKINQTWLCQYPEAYTQLIEEGAAGLLQVDEIEHAENGDILVSVGWKSRKYKWWSVVRLRCKADQFITLEKRPKSH